MSVVFGNATVSLPLKYPLTSRQEPPVSSSSHRQYSGIAAIVLHSSAVGEEVSYGHFHIHKVRADYRVPDYASPLQSRLVLTAGHTMVMSSGTRSPAS